MALIPSWRLVCGLLQVWSVGASGWRVRNPVLESLLLVLVCVTTVQLHELDAQLEQRVGGGADGTVAARLTGLREGRVRCRAQTPEVDGADGPTSSHSNSTLRACRHTADSGAER